MSPLYTDATVAAVTANNTDAYSVTILVSECTCHNLGKMRVFPKLCVIVLLRLQPYRAALLLCHTCIQQLLLLRQPYLTAASVAVRCCRHSWPGPFMILAACDQYPSARAAQGNTSAPHCTQHHTLDMANRIAQHSTQHACHVRIVQHSTTKHSCHATLDAA